MQPIIGRTALHCLTQVKRIGERSLAAPIGAGAYVTIDRNRQKW